MDWHQTHLALLSIWKRFKKGVHPHSPGFYLTVEPPDRKTVCYSASCVIPEESVSWVCSNSTV